MDNIKAIAQDVRNWVQAKADQSGYHADDLNGWCAIAAAELYKKLAAAGISAEIQMWNGDEGCHAYVVCEDHVVDVTATQFKPLANVPVYIAHIKEAEQRYYFYCTSEVFNSAAALRRYQKKNRWPNQQTAYD